MSTHTEITAIAVISGALLAASTVMLIAMIISVVSPSSIQLPSQAILPMIVGGATMSLISYLLARKGEQLYAELAEKEVKHDA